MKTTCFDQSKALNSAYEWKNLLPTVILTAWAPWTPCFWPSCTLGWLYTVPLKNKVERKPTIYRSGSAFFTIANEFTTYWSFSALLLPVLDTFVIFMWLDSVYKIVLSMKIKYDKSRNRNNCVMRIISIVVLVRSKIIPLTFAWFSSFWCDSIRYIVLFWVRG